MNFLVVEVKFTFSQVARNCLANQSWARVPKMLSCLASVRIFQIASHLATSRTYPNKNFAHTGSRHGKLCVSAIQYTEKTDPISLKLILRQHFKCTKFLEALSKIQKLIIYGSKIVKDIHQKFQLIWVQGLALFSIYKWEIFFHQKMYNVKFLVNFV